MELEIESNINGLQDIRVHDDKQIRKTPVMKTMERIVQDRKTFKHNNANKNRNNDKLKKEKQEKIAYASLDGRIFSFSSD